ncbi:hypothetical protein JCM8547_000770, partial [Rhodosporidiobolus lusitaniae]
MEPSSSPTSLPLSSSLAPTSPPPVTSTGGPVVRVLSSEQEDLASRPPRPPSRSSISLGRSASRDTVASQAGGAGLQGGGTMEAERGPSPAPPAAGGPGERRTSTTAGGGGVSGVLPGAAFLNPRIPSASSSSPRVGAASPPPTFSVAPTLSSSERPLSAASASYDPFVSPSTASSSSFSPSSVPAPSASPPPTNHPYGYYHGTPAALTTSPRQRNGPVITRVSSAMSPPLPSVSPEPERAVSPPALRGGGQRMSRVPSSPGLPSAAGGAAGRRSSDNLFHPRLSQNALSLSSDELAADLAAGGVLAASQGMQRHRRAGSSSSDLAFGAGAGGAERPESRLSQVGETAVPGAKEIERVRGTDETLDGSEFRAGTIPLPGTVSTAASTIGGAGGFSTKPSTEPLLPLHHSHQRPTSPSSLITAARPVQPHHHHEQDLPFSSLPPRPSSLLANSSLPPFPPPLNPFIHPPLTPLSPPLRVFQSHPGRNRFPLRGYCLTSGDNPVPFLGSLGVAVGAPVGWMVFNAGWWCRNWGGEGGEGVVVVFGFLTAVVWASM